VLQSVACGLREDDVLLGVLPLFHIFGLNVLMNTGLSRGATLVLMPRFDLEDFLRAIQTHRATYAFVVPPILLALAKHPLVANFDLSSLDRLLSGAAPLGEALAREVESRVGCTVMQGYGLTETSPVVLVSSLDGRMPKDSAGLPVPGTECRIVDPESGLGVAPGGRGELWIRGPQVMKGYLNRPEDTAAVLDSEGWFHTGDIACADELGQIFVVDRLKELIKVKGMQVAPAELEALLLSHPAVADAAVIPVPDERAGERPKAFVVLKAGQDGEAQELMDFVAGRVAAHKRISEVEFISVIPKSPSGKILRRLLVERERLRRSGGD
jgi:acyl-CoA synthetase (AMP-forming)/AMP-acid ligase II